MKLLWRSLAVLASAVLLFACASPQPSQPVTITLLPGSPPVGTTVPTTTFGVPTDTSPPAGTPGEATAEIELIITGGPADGSYRAVIHGTSCTEPSTGQLVATYA